jgi:hypothetical protein
MASRKREFSTRIEAAAGSLLSLTTDGHHWLARSSRATDPCFVFLEQLNVSPSHGRGRKGTDEESSTTRYTRRT